jgi:hypothetical protein
LMTAWRTSSRLDVEVLEDPRGALSPYAQDGQQQCSVPDEV